MYKYSLCCISNELRENKLSFKTMTRKSWLNDRNIKKLRMIWLHNLEVLSSTMHHCGTHGWNYRASASIFPLFTLKDDLIETLKVDAFEDLDFLQRFNNAAAMIKIFRIRVSMHPDQFCSLGSPKKEVVENTIAELELHGKILDALKCPKDYNSPINIHVTNCVGGKAVASKRFLNHLLETSDSVKNRLVVENEDKGCWNVDALLEYFWSRNNIPITFDNLHYKCNPQKIDCLNYVNAFEKCVETWKHYNIIPLFHYSESDIGHLNCRSHANMPTSTPYREGLNHNNDWIDWEIELKSKDMAIHEIERMDIIDGLALNKLTRDSEELGFYDYYNFAKRSFVR